MSVFRFFKASMIDDCRGSNLIELALVLPIFLILIFGSVDFGRAYYQAIEVESAAHAGAVYGLQNPQDTDGMQSAALVGASNVSDLTATATYGCECSDGTSDVTSCTYTPSCPDNYVTYVDVATTSTFKPMFHYPGLPKEITFRGDSHIRVGGN